MKFGTIFVIIGVLFLTVGFAVPLSIVASGPTGISGTGGTGSTTTSTSYSLSATLTVSPSSVAYDGKVVETLHVDSESGGPMAMFEVDLGGTWSAFSALTITSTGTFSATWVAGTPGIHQTRLEYVTYESSTGSITYGTINGPDITVANQIVAPVINSFSSSVNPSVAGQTVQFSTNVNWGGQTGQLTYAVDDYNIQGSSYTFNLSGSYNIQVTAANSAGSVTSSLTQVVQANIQPPTVTSVSASPNPVQTGTLVTFSSTVQWNGQTGNVTYYVGNTAVSGNTYTFTSAGNYTITAKAVNSAGASTATNIEVVYSPGSTVSTPVIDSFTASPNPIDVNQQITFLTTVNWDGATGNISYYIGSTLLTSNTYTFTSTGTYTAKEIATNSAGSTSATLTVLVQAVSTTGNNTGSGQIQNIGTFAISENGSSPFYIQPASQYDLHPHLYPYEVMIYYVENHGQTTNMSQVYITINEKVYSISFTNLTQVKGHTAYSIKLEMQPGSFNINAYIKPSTSINGGLPIQTTSFVINTQQLSTTTYVSSTNYVFMGLGSLLILVGAVMIVRRY